MSSRTEQPGHGINANTVLLAIILAVSGYSLKKLVDIGEAQAAMDQRLQSLERLVYKSD